MRSFTFYRRFQDDILAGRKTITLRDSLEADVTPGEVLCVSRLEDGGVFCHLRVLAVTPVAPSELNDTHARQENMSLSELRQLIQTLYPDIQQLYCIEFALC